MQSNVSMHALPHDPSFIILTLATFLKWRKMLQSALPLVSEKKKKYVRMSARVRRVHVFRLLVEDRGEECVCVCVRAFLYIIVCLCTCISMIKEHGNMALAIYC